MDKITLSLLSSFSEQCELTRLDDSVQFEHFANYSVLSKQFRGSFELDDVHTGKGCDCGIDGLYIIVNGRMVNDVDELREIVEPSGCLDAEIGFIQAKTTSSFSGSEIGSLILGIKDFLNDEPKLVQNFKVKSKKKIWDEIILLSSYMTNRRPNCKIFYTCTGKWVNDQNLRAVIDSGVAEIDSLSVFESIQFEPLGASEIQRLYHETKNKLSATINFQNRIILPDIDGVSEGYLGILPLNEYLKLIQDTNHTIHSIFDDNVRDFQGDNPVNKKIKENLEAKKFDIFCVLNNGVTVVATSITAAGTRFTIRDYQVVNGCQTSHILHECQYLEGIEQVQVPIKIVVTEDEDIKTRITLATNSQTEVKTEQLEALSLFQKQLELYYSAEKNSIRLYYERRSQQYNSVIGIKRNQIISIPIQIKSFASMFLNSPHLVSGYYGTIVKRFEGKMFADGHKLLPYFVSSLCYYRVEQFFRSGDLNSEYKKARFHLMLLVRLIAMGENLDPFNSNKIERAAENFKAILLNEDDALNMFKVAESIFEVSGVDLSKTQYKSEAETELLIKAYQKYLEHCHQKQ